MVATCPPGKKSLGMRTVTKEVNGTSKTVQEPHCADEDDKGNINFNSSNEDSNESKKVSKTSIKSDDPGIEDLLKKERVWIPLLALGILFCLLVSFYFLKYIYNLYFKNS